MIIQHVDHALVDIAKPVMRMGVVITYDYAPLNREKYEVNLGGHTFVVNHATLSAMMLWCDRAGMLRPQHFKFVGRRYVNDAR